MTSTNYLWCGVPENPWEDMFCGTGSTQPVETEQKPDWDNPFGLAPPQQSTHADNRSVDSSGTGGRSTGRYGEARSVGSIGSTATNKTFQDLSREEKARKRALILSETLMVQGELNAHDTERKKSVGLGGNTMSSVHAEMILEKNKNGTEAMKNVGDKVLANQAAAAFTRKIIKEIKKTETTRPKKELTAEDIRDPETVPGMVSRAGIAMEEDAKKKARLMISNGKYPHHEKAGNAIWSYHDVNRIRKTDGKLNPIV
jgi:hypothetical protein